jgi:hypothetical protein
MFWAVTHYYPEAAASIGRILAGYPQVEYSMLECLDAVREDYDVVYRYLFGVRGETQRVEIANALGRHFYHELDLGTDFDSTFDAIRHLLRIRNQYAHAHWLANETGMSMAGIEELAKSKTYATGESEVALHSVTLEIVRQQEQYGDYVSSMLAWLTDEAKIKRGKATVNRFPKPERTVPPPLKRPKG